MWWKIRRGSTQQINIKTQKKKQGKFFTLLVYSFFLAHIHRKISKVHLFLLKNSIRRDWRVERKKKKKSWKWLFLLLPIFISSSLIHLQWYSVLYVSEYEIFIYFFPFSSSSTLCLDMHEILNIFTYAEMWSWCRESKTKKISRLNFQKRISTAAEKHLVMKLNKKIKLWISTIKKK